MRQHRDLAQRHAGRVADGGEDRRRRRDERRLADAFGAEGALRFRILDQPDVDLRHVADRRDQIVVQVLGAAGDELLHQREAEPLRDAAMDLALDEGRVDGAADVVGGDHAQHLRRAEDHVDLDLRHLRRKAVGRVRNDIRFCPREKFRH